MCAECFVWKGLLRSNIQIWVNLFAKAFSLIAYVSKMAVAMASFQMRVPAEALCSLNEYGLMTKSRDKIHTFLGSVGRKHLA